MGLSLVILFFFSPDIQLLSQLPLVAVFATRDIADSGK